MKMLKKNNHEKWAKIQGSKSQKNQYVKNLDVLTSNIS